MDCCKKVARDENLIKDINNRMNRVIGQLNGINNMIKENRYCMDILIQLAASEAALKELGYIILKDHLLTCVNDDIKNNDTSTLIEAFEISKKLN